MSDREKQRNYSVAKQNEQPSPLFLEEWIRGDIIGHASNPMHAETMRELPTRRLAYYCIARRLAITLENLMLNSLHYSRKLVENPGRDAIDQAVADLRHAASLCLNSRSRSYGLIEEQIRSIVMSLPYTWPDELAKEPESFLAVSHSEVAGLISQSSSGTTGQLSGEFKRIFCTAGDQERTIQFFTHGMRYLLNSAQGDRVALLLARGERGGGNLADLFTEAMRRINVPCLVPADADDEAATLAELDEFRPTTVIATPRQIISLFRASEHAARISRIKAGLENILISGDRISSGVSQILGRELEVDVFLHYGMVESGLGTAVECRRRNGCHYREADFLIEIITPDGVSHPLPQNMRDTVYVDPSDIDGGQVYGPTPWGEITITSLSREASPLLRYRTGDSGRIIVDKCACGSTVWRLEARGRIGDFVALPQLPDDDPSAPPRIVHGGLDRALYTLPWVKDHQTIVHEDADGVACNLGISVLLNGEAPSDAEAAAAIEAAISAVKSRASARGVGIFIRLARSRDDFKQFFHYTTKRSFLRSSEPLDQSLYMHPQDSRARDS